MQVATIILFGLVVINIGKQILDLQDNAMLTWVVNPAAT
jgi:hypothetical protein